MKKIFLKLLLASSPLIFVVSVYLINDPFKVLWRHSTYYTTDGGINHLPGNTDFYATELFLKNNNTEKYNSFIFGNSRSRFYKVDQWKKYIGNDASGFHYDGNQETLYGVERKLNMLDQRDIPIKNVLLIFDSELVKSTVNPTMFIYRKHPLLSGENRFDFQLTFFKAYMDVDFLKEYYHLLITKKPSEKAVSNFVLQGDDRMDAIETLNEVSLSSMDAALASNADSTYAHLGPGARFYPRDTNVRYSQPVIDNEQKKLLVHIKQILDKHNTNYRIVINLLFDQKRLAASDLTYLQTLFGAGNVYNFSGRNSITEDKHNYYENSHYRPFIASMILDSIYKKH